MKTSLTSVFLLLVNIVVAQTGPGGVGNAADNVLWLSADNGVYNNTAGTIPAAGGENVALWADRSGNGRNATHGVNGERPNYETNILNGLPVIQFTAANGDRLLSQSVSTANTASVWAVASWTTLPSPNPGIIQASPAGSGFSSAANDKVIGMWVNNGNNVWGRGVEADNNARDIPQVTSTTSGTYYSFLNLYNGATITQYVNNAVAGSITYDGTLKSWSDFGIGRQANESWNGNIAEVIAYNIAVNSAQRMIVNNYLAAKYNLTLSAANDVYTMDNAGNGDFDYEVAGIGRVDASNIHNSARGSGIVQVSDPSGLGNNEFFMWGHDNGSLSFSVTSSLPSDVTARVQRIWRVSENSDVGSIDVDFDLTGIADLASMSTCQIELALRLLVDTDNDSNFGDQTSIRGATHLGSNVYRFENVTAIGNNMRFTLGVSGSLNNGPGGVGTGDGSSTLKLWFRTDNGVSATGSTVDSWANSAGIAALDVSETGGQRPTLVTNAVNGFSEISFNGSNRLRTGLTLTTSNFVVDRASSFVVCRADNTTQQSCVYLTDPLETNRFANHIPWAGTVYYDIGSCCGTETRLDVGGLTGLNGYSVWAYDANAAAGKQLYRNGGLLLSRASVSTYSSHATHRFNIGGNTTGTEGFAGDMTEVIIFNDRVNSAQRNIVVNYLAAKYGIALTSNDIYTRDDAGQGNFDFDVAGIGRVDASNVHNDSRGTGTVRVFNPTDLENNEYFMWGHDNGSLGITNTTDVPATIQGRMTRTWRVSETGGDSNVGNLDMQFDLTGQGPVTASDLRLLIDHDGDGNFAEGGTIIVSGAVAVGCNNYVFSGVSGASMTNGVRFTIGSINISQTPLPVELKSFTGEIVEGDALLQWTTASETNNHYFTVERSDDGKNFRAVGNVSGAGTTREEKTYNFEDVFVPYGVLYYRVKQTDFDGAHSYSGIVRLENKTKGTQLLAIPNPVSDGEVVRLRIKHSEKIDVGQVKVRAFDVVGNEVPVSVEADGEGGLLMHFLNGGSSGIYIITASAVEIRNPLTTRIFKK